MAESHLKCGQSTTNGTAREQNPVPLEAEVVMEMRRSMFLDDINQTLIALASWLLCAWGLGRNIEPSLSLVRFQAHNPRSSGASWR